MQLAVDQVEAPQQVRRLPQSPAEVAPVHGDVGEPQHGTAGPCDVGHRPREIELGGQRHARLDAPEQVELRQLQVHGGGQFRGAGTEAA